MTAALLLKFWREATIVVLVLALWGTWSCKGRASDSAARRLANEQLARVVAEGNAQACDAALAVEVAAVKLHVAQTVADKAARRAAEEDAAERQRLDELALQERDLRVEELRRQIAAAPEGDRCEKAAQWVLNRFREVTRAPR